MRVPPFIFLPPFSAAPLWGSAMLNRIWQIIHSFLRHKMHKLSVRSLCDLHPQKMGPRHMEKCREPCCPCLYPAGVIQGDPPCIGFQFSPPGGAFAVRFLNNGKHAHSCNLPCLGLICARRFPDVQVGDGHPHKVRLECRRFGVHRLPGFIEHGMPRIWLLYTTPSPRDS